MQLQVDYTVIAAVRQKEKRFYALHLRRKIPPSIKSPTVAGFPVIPAFAGMTEAKVLRMLFLRLAFTQGKKAAAKQTQPSPAREW